ncbi:MAG: hypothetical protein ACRD0U_19550 [Acidimicrobiales bacterium]
MITAARRQLVAPLETADLPVDERPAPVDSALDLRDQSSSAEAVALVDRAANEAERLVQEASDRAEALLRETEQALRARAEGILAVLEPLRLALDRLDTLRALVEIAAARLSEIVDGSYASTD